MLRLVVEGAIILFCYIMRSVYNVEMNENDYIEKAKVKYKELEEIYCPYLKSKVRCSSKGFNHLIYKSDRTRRLEVDIKARLKSLSKLKEIIECSGTLQEKEVRENGQIYFAFIAIIDDKKYKVVISDTDKGEYMFRSIIPKWKTGKRDNISVKTKISSD